MIGNVDWTGQFGKVARLSGHSGHSGGSSGASGEYREVDTRWWLKGHLGEFLSMCLVFGLIFVNIPLACLVGFACGRRLHLDRELEAHERRLYASLSDEATKSVPAARINVKRVEMTMWREAGKWNVWILRFMKNGTEEAPAHHRFDLLSEATALVNQTEGYYLDRGIEVEIMETS